MENDTEQTPTTVEAPQLSAIELRVLGVLMEKQLTTPDQYPLTLNSVITACNQKSSRDPVTNYEQGEISRALTHLDDRHFVRRERSSRAEKFEQQFMNHLALGRKQQALLCVMMLRGPQTISELSTRTQRMCEFVDKEELELCIDRLCQREIPYTVRLAQQAGQRGERVMHLFSGLPTDVATQQTTESSVSESDSLWSNTNLRESTALQSTDADAAVSELQRQHSDLQQKYEELQLLTSELKHSLEQLYTLTGHSPQHPSES